MNSTDVPGGNIDTDRQILADLSRRPDEPVEYILT
jgi:hypothetical protein